jgi:hypothetical protein
VNNPFTKGLFGDLDLGAAGTVFTDSYDSDLGTYASQATNFHPASGRTFALPNGDLGSNGEITLRGTVVVIGDATPGPGHSVSISGGGVIVAGSTAPASESTSLTAAGYDPPIAAGGAFSQNSGTHTFGSGSYRYTSFSLGSKASYVVAGDVTLYVDGNFSVGAQATIEIQPGASLTIRQGGADFDLGGGGILNGTQEPGAFIVFSEATSVKITGNSGLYGAVYAPGAIIEPKGTSAIFGSFVGRQVYVGGTADFHYDEALARKSIDGLLGRFIVLSWRKVAPVSS